MKKLLFVIGFFILSVSHCYGQLIYQNGRLAFNQPISEMYNTVWNGQAHQWRATSTSFDLLLLPNEVYMGTTAPTNKIIFINRILGVYNDIACRTIYQLSDIKFKTNIKSLRSESRNGFYSVGNSDGVASIVQCLNPVSFQWANDSIKYNSGRSNTVEYGFIAQEVKQVLPEIVCETSEGDLSINYIALIPILTATIQELTERVEFLENKLERLENTSVK